MKLVLATDRLGLGGSESYLITIAEQLERLGHEILIFAAEPGRGADLARARDLEVGGTSILPDACDALVVQDAAVSYELAARYPEAPQVFVAHSAYYDLQFPPQLDGMVSAIVVLNDRIARHVESLEVGAQVVRLRQPIDLRRFPPGVALRDTPGRALVLSNAMPEERYATLQSICDEAGVELHRVGGSKQSLDPRPAIWRADLVFGYGRSLLEAMASGRAAYVYDHRGGDGWVTAATYPTLESDGFGGSATPGVIDARRLRDDLHRFDPEMGAVNRDLIAQNHRAGWHAQELLKVLRAAAAPRHGRRTQQTEMARLVRLERRARAELAAMTRESARHDQALAGLRQRVEKQQAEIDRLAADRKRQHETIRQLQEERRRVARVRHDYETTLSWRMTRPLRALRRLLRRRR